MDPWPLSSLTFSKFQIRWILEDLVTFHFGGCRDSDCHLCILKSLPLPKKEESNYRDECYVVHDILTLTRIWLKVGGKYMRVGVNRISLSPY